MIIAYIKTTRPSSPKTNQIGKDPIPTSAAAWTKVSFQQPPGPYITKKQRSKEHEDDEDSLSFFLFLKQKDTCNPMNNNSSLFLK